MPCPRHAGFQSGWMSSMTTYCKVMIQLRSAVKRKSELKKLPGQKPMQVKIQILFGFEPTLLNFRLRNFERNFRLQLLKREVGDPMKRLGATAAPA